MIIIRVFNEEKKIIYIYIIYIANYPSSKIMVQRQQWPRVFVSLICTLHNSWSHKKTAQTVSETTQESNTYKHRQRKLHWNDYRIKLTWEIFAIHKKRTVNVYIFIKMLTLHSLQLIKIYFVSVFCCCYCCCSHLWFIIILWALAYVHTHKQICKTKL